MRCLSQDRGYQGESQLVPAIDALNSVRYRDRNLKRWVTTKKIDMNKTKEHKPSSRAMQPRRQRPSLCAAVAALVLASCCRVHFTLALNENAVRVSNRGDVNAVNPLLSSDKHIEPR